MNAVMAPIRPERHAVAGVAPEATSLLVMIERAARDPDVDIDKFERLLAVKKAIESERKQEIFDAAMADAQAEMPRVSTDRDNNQTRSRYASYAAIDRAIRPIYTKHGFSVTYNTAPSDKPEHVTVFALVAHRAGCRQRYDIDMPVDGKGAKGGDVMTKTHAMGSGFEYGKRYLLKGIFNVAIGDDPEDDDGNGGGGAEREPNATSGAAKTNTPPPNSLPAYPDDKFQQNLPSWKGLIEAGRPPENVIATLRTKYSVSPEQEKQIRSLKTQPETVQ